ncbi:MAG: FN3 associated domain-containing protein, partial [Opitutaceae bacterium]
TSGASIRYTTDGSAPSETAGTLYSGPISIGATTTIKAIGYKSGDTDSAIASATYTIGSSSGCITATAGGGWKNNPMASQTGTFTATFDATPSAGPTNAVVALSNGAQTSYSNFPCLARFNPTGDIDARNGGAYAATTVIPYAAGVTYHFRMVVNVSAQTYSIYVTPAGGSELTVGLNYTFRVSATSLSNWGAYVDGSGGTGTLTVCNFSIGGSGPTPFTIAASAGANGSISPSGNITVDQGATQTFVVTPNSGYVVAAVTVDGSSAGQVTSYTFNNVQANHTISVTFQQSVPTTFTITATAAVNGSISPSGNIVVNQGASQSFTITPSSSYTVASVTVDGSSVGAVTSYTFNNVQANHTINAVFQASGGGCVTATVGGGWKNNPMAAETGTFTDTFDATPSASPTNAVVALSNGAQTSYSNFPCLVRFNPSGDIDARNGGAYAAATAIPYSAGVTYHFRLVVNVSAQTYSIYVTPAGGSELTVGLNYAFRVSATSLSNWGVYVDSGSGGTGTVAVCNFSL